MVAKSITFDMYKCVIIGVLQRHCLCISITEQNVIISMVHSTSTKSMDIMDIKNLQQNLLGRILHRKKHMSHIKS